MPFSILSVCFGLMVVGVLNFISYIAGSGDILLSSSKLFHVFHPVHLLFSAIATTSMFWQHEKKFIKAVVVGFFGPAGICGISDILFHMFQDYYSAYICIYMSVLLSIHL